MTTTLITGANKGLGFETARQLVAAGHTVYLGSRDPERGRIAAEQLGAVPLVVDITDDASVTAAAETLAAAGGLDVLVNNAAIAGPVTTVGEVTGPVMRELFETNVFGVVRMMHAFLPLLEKSPAPVVVNVSSGLGSVDRSVDPAALESRVPALAYGSSKSAVNMLTVRYAQAYPAMRINCVDPGYTATDLNGHQGHQTVEQGAEIIVRMARLGPDGVTGAFLAAGGTVPW
jgi:NAD(P)-dependent dehydrogenase (short-subunit alcohol dehydrogenase family)